MALVLAGEVEPAFDNYSMGGGMRKGQGGKVGQDIGTPTFSNGSGLGGGGMGHHQDGSMMHGLQAAMQNQNVPPSPSGSQSQDHKLLQMQQQFLLNQLPGGLPNRPLSVQSYQQVLTQRFKKLNRQHQTITQQLKMNMARGGGSGSLNSSDPSASMTVHQMNLKLQQIQHHMTQIVQQLNVISQISSQQPDPTAAMKPQDPLSTGMGSSVMGVGLGNSRGKGYNGSSKQGGSSLGRSHSTSGIPEEGESPKGLMCNMQDLSLGGLVSQSSALSMSRFHQIFSGSSSGDNLIRMGGIGDGGSSQDSSPFSPPQGTAGTPTFTIGGGGGGLGCDPTSSENTPPTPSSAFLPSGGKAPSFTDNIQEFKPGVPWQPRSQATEPAQLYSKQSSMPVGGGAGGGSYDNFSAVMAQSPSYPPANLPSPMFGGQGSGGQAKPVGKYMRSNSTGGGFYGIPGSGGGGGGTSGFGSSKRLPSPSVKYSHYTPRADASASRHQGGGAGAGGWNSSGSSGSLSSESSLSGGFGGGGGGGGGGNGHGPVIQTRTYYPSSNRTAQSPVVTMGGTQFPGSDRTQTWKQPKQQQQQQLQQQVLPTGGGGRRIAPPTSLPPRGGRASSGLHVSRSTGATPLSGMRELFGGSGSSSSSSNSQTPSIAEDKWGALAMTPGSLTPLTPSSAVLLNPVWGSGSLTTPDTEIQQNQWKKEEVSKIWNQTQDPGPASLVAPSKPPGLSVVNPDPSLVYMKTSSSESKISSSSSPSEGVNSSPFVTTPSFSSGTWGQDEIESSSEVQKETLSPEPTFAEWQAGKKARLSVVFKLPPTQANSCWLVIKNITKQVCSHSIREVASFQL